jgi:CRISPR-associated protein Cas2
MKGATDFAVVYDISCDRERARVDKVLKGFGFRVQKSVYECPLTRRAYTAVVKALEALDLQTGFVKIYRLHYTSSRPVIGKPPAASSPSGMPVDAGSAFIV